MVSSLGRYALLCAGLTLGLIGLGGVVRATGAGLACPDWPLCQGRLVPPLQGPVLIEYSHRLLAAVVGLATLLLATFVWRRQRRHRGLLGLVVAALVLLGGQVVLGGLTVRTELTAALVAGHLGTAATFLAVLLLLYAATWRRRSGGWPASPALRATAPLAAVVVLAQMVLGGYVSGSGAALACPDFPLCRGAVIPRLVGPVLPHFLHRVGALAVALVVFLVAWQARRSGTPLRRLALGSAGLVVVQIALGALNIATRVVPPVTVLHLLAATVLFGNLVLLVGLSAAPQREALPRRWRQTAADYLALTKPRIVLLLLVTTATTMVVAGGRHLSPPLVAWTMLGGALAAGAANALNMYWDRDVDARMQRTRLRPVPAGRLPPRHALAFGLVLAVLSVIVLGLLVNWLSAALALAGILFYVLIYTAWLKRLTPQNIVIGGAAGAVPPLVGWAAVTGQVAAPAVLLFAVIFLWTPPHFWALALARRQDYAAAGIPMLPVVAGVERTRREIVRYTLALVAVTLLLVPFGGAGPVYLVSALALGSGFILMTRGLGRDPGGRAALHLFAYSTAYLALLFGALALDRVV
ncbi:MAG: heme o synthase [Armatimonadota bacterium]|nr:heme o synthase [Armatimonadota bacterium]MDR7469746.1 heme o synthase [Armatimonadota bacterium]